jgi:hypothetical protein
MCRNSTDAGDRHHSAKQHGYQLFHFINSCFIFYPCFALFLLTNSRVYSKIKSESINTDRGAVFISTGWKGPQTR